MTATARTLILLALACLAVPNVAGAETIYVQGECAGDDPDGHSHRHVQQQRNEDLVEHRGSDGPRWSLWSRGSSGTRG